jgi:hypothetical protein
MFFAVVFRNIAVPVNFAKVGKLAQTVFHNVPRLSIRNQAFQCLDSQGDHKRSLSLSVQLVSGPLLSTQ